jgi:ribosomal protein L2
MPIKSFRPITPTLRFQTKLVNDDITTSEPHKPLLAVKPRTGGRNNIGRLSVRHHGGGHKQKLRIIDFKRDMVFRPRSQPLSTIRIAARASHWFTMPMGRSGTSCSLLA